MEIFRLKRHQERRVLRGHPWIFSNELTRLTSDMEPGTLVEVQDPLGRFIGRGYFNPHSLIAVRLLTRTNQAIDSDFFIQRIHQADLFRKRIFPEERSYRVVFSEADGLPGLIVDRYENNIVLQITTAGMERWISTICDVLVEMFKPKTIVARNDTAIRELEGLKLEKRVLYGSVESSTVITKNGLEFELDLLEGQKTGFYLDQSENYAKLQGLVTGGTVLDGFCYAGGWALHAVRYGAKKVIGLDSSEKAIGLAMANARRNGLENRCDFRKADLFDELRKQVSRGDRYDGIVLDPPAFIKSKTKLKEGLRGYREINRCAMELVKPGGILVTCSCSYHLDREGFRKMLSQAAQEAGRTTRLLEFRSQSRDHPVLLSIPETDYLKCAILMIE
ncbi:MAG TPA: class I SAM-dependent rRNA methyltransferase [Nitrospiria bacterium]|nr:class I SAM-dependent rRNA methyltransferase [Nitrospiria bacterium]